MFFKWIKRAARWCWDNKYVPVAVLGVIAGAILTHKATSRDKTKDELKDELVDHEAEAKDKVGKIHDEVVERHKPEMDDVDKREVELAEVEKITDESERLKALADLGKKQRGKREDKERGQR